jgi:hypothetical protein
MRYRMRVQEDVQKILENYTVEDTFTWKDLKKLNLQNSIMFYSFNPIFKVVGKDKDYTNIYRLDKDVLEKDLKFKIVRRKKHEV